jgi:hypothetical protein
LKKPEEQSEPSSKKLEEPLAPWSKKPEEQQPARSPVPAPVQERAELPPIGRRRRYQPVSTCSLPKPGPFQVQSQTLSISLFPSSWFAFLGRKAVPFVMKLYMGTLQSPSPSIRDRESRGELSGLDQQGNTGGVSLLLKISMSCR